MHTYTLLKNGYTVKRSDGAFFPTEIENGDYQVLLNDLFAAGLIDENAKKVGTLPQPDNKILFYDLNPYLEEHKFAKSKHIDMCAEVATHKVVGNTFGLALIKVLTASDSERVILVDRLSNIEQIRQRLLFAIDECGTTDDIDSVVEQKNDFFRS